MANCLLYDSTWMLVLAVGIGFLIASPQLWTACRYYPHSIRAGKTTEQKMDIGNVPITRMLSNLLSPTVEPIDGVFGPEAMTFIGIPALVCLPFAGWSWWWVVAGLATVLAMGRHTPVFRWTHWLHLRCPARYTYFVGLSLAMLAVDGYQSFSAAGQQLVLLLQSVSLLLTLPRLWPMKPYVQRWERPSQAFNTPLTRYFASCGGSATGRVSGLPYPLRTGQINQIMTLGYNGGSQATWMARFRRDSNPNGSGAHDWFPLNADGPALDWYGVRWAYTGRRLVGKWCSTPLPRLYENRQASSIPSWKEVSAWYGVIR